MRVLCRADGILTVKSRWQEYAAQIKKEEAYVAVCKNVTGSRPREMFDDVLEEMEAQYTKDKVRGHAWKINRPISYQ